MGKRNHTNATLNLQEEKDRVCMGCLPLQTPEFFCCHYKANKTYESSYTYFNLILTLVFLNDSETVNVAIQRDIFNKTHLFLGFF